MTIETKIISLRAISALGVIGFVAGSTMAWASLLNRVSALETSLQEEKVVYSQLTWQQEETKLTLVQMQTELKGMNGLLLEIRSKIYR